MAGTIVVDRIESDASYASTINVAGQITFSNTVNFGAYSGTAPVAGFYLPTTNNLAFTTASTERMRLDSSGNIQIGSTSYISTVSATQITPRLQLHGTSLGTTTFAQYAWNSTNPYHTFNTSGAGGIGVHAAVTSADTIGNIQFNGSDGTSFVGGAAIKALPEGTISTGVLPANLRFYTAAPSTGTLTERMRIDSSGNVGIGTSSPATTNGIVTLNVGLKSANNIVLGFETTNLQYGGSLEFRRTARTTQSRFAQITGAEDNSGNGLLYFYTAAAGSDVSENMRLDGSGNLKFNSGYGSAATAYGCRAWVNYSATAGSTSIRGSGNISSITYNAVGDHTLNFSTAMPDANYALIGYSGQATGDARHIGAITSQTTSAIRYLVQYISNTGGGGTAINNTNNHLAIFR